MHPYTIEFECSYKELWRYNITITGGVFNHGTKEEFISYSDEVAPVGSKLSSPPKGYSPSRDICLTTASGDSLTLYIYVVPNTIPMSRVVGDAPTFECLVRISHGSDIVYHKIHNINQWSGDNIEIKL